MYNFVGCGFDAKSDVIVHNWCGLVYKAVTSLVQNNFVQCKHSDWKLDLAPEAVAADVLLFAPF